MLREDYIKAGRLAAEAREYGKSLIKKGSYLLDVIEKVEEKIKSSGGDFAFPPQISCDDIAAHFCPEKDDKIVLENQLVCLDIGVHINGFIGDCACSVDLSGQNSELVKASEEALKEATKILQIGTKLKDIGKTIQQTIESFGFKPVRNLSGHGLSQWNIHDIPTIPNFDNKDETTLTKGMTIAIEPFATNGIGLIEEKGDPSVFGLTGKKSVRVGFVRNIQKEIEKLNGLPFTTRWLTNKFSEAQVRYSLNQLKLLKILHEYPPLVEKQGGLVSQAENSFLIDDKVVCLTKI
ncbi:type II methionyl aminopeptidase [Candidatus Woesearchaeota archaeon B3_Woes]|nr:MAG: type II methionyl aminopeptidase [Candidatus Woesearchaeota archaeon B3_Woes]